MSESDTQLEYTLALLVRPSKGHGKIDFLEIKYSITFPLKELSFLLQTWPNHRAKHPGLCAIRGLDFLDELPVCVHPRRSQGESVEGSAVSRSSARNSGL